MRAAALLLGPDSAAEARLASLGCEVSVIGRDVPGGWGAAVRQVLARTTARALVVDARPEELDALLGPLERDEADVVLGRRPRVPWAERAVNQVAALALQDEGSWDASSPARAFRVAALAAEPVKGDGEEAEAEALVKLAAQHYRLTEVQVASRPMRPLSVVARLARTFGRYATLQNDADNQHEGYSTLAHLEAGAPNYNAWLGDTFSRWAGRRVLEIGAGIGTITAHLAPGRDLVTALEVDEFYVRRLRNRFRGQPHVEPYQSDVALADWRALAKRQFDTIVLSNVLEHIPDDAGAVRTFANILPVGGRLILYVPALQALFGSLDEAVGHHRRYTPEALRAVLVENGFDVEHLQWMNLVGIPGWYVNGKVLKRRVLPPLQLRLYDRIAPWLAKAESHVKLPVGLSLLCVAKRRREAQHAGTPP
ncbi:MAG: bifunctional glycosyltransferase/class I SAM-dependent methyltransferase [Myxococcota bacterium]